MVNQGLYKLWGGAYTRFKPNLCPHCIHFIHPNENAEVGGMMADGGCKASGKLLSSPNSKTGKGRCSVYLENTQNDVITDNARAYAYQEWREHFFGDDDPAAIPYCILWACRVHNLKINRATFDQWCKNLQSAIDEDARQADLLDGYADRASL